MARGTTEKRRLIKFSNYSMCVTLPKWVIDQLEWKKGEQLTLTTDIKQGKITLYKESARQVVTTTNKGTKTKAAAQTDSPIKLRW